MARSAILEQKDWMTRLFPNLQHSRFKLTVISKVINPVSLNIGIIRKKSEVIQAFHTINEFFEIFSSCKGCHSRAGGNPEYTATYWITAGAGTTSISQIREYFKGLNQRLTGAQLV